MQRRKLTVTECWFGKRPGPEDNDFNNGVIVGVLVMLFFVLIEKL